MKRILLFALVLSAFTGSTLTFKGTGQRSSTIVNTYAASQVDTVKYTFEGVESGLHFYAHVGDSTSITNVILRRVSDGKLRAVMVGDTIVGAVVARQDTVISGTVSPTPLNEQLWFFVTYAATAQGVTSPNVTYGLVKLR